MKSVEVAVGVIIRGSEIFITKRDDHLHQGGKWEFPGGKKEECESIETALCRELNEEVGIDVSQYSRLMTIDHDYGDKKVTLDVFVVDGFTHEPHGKEGQSGHWVSIKNLIDFDFPAANVAIVNKLRQQYLTA